LYPPAEREQGPCGRSLAKLGEWRTNGGAVSLRWGRRPKLVTCAAQAGPEFAKQMAGKDERRGPGGRQSGSSGVGLCGGVRAALARSQVRSSGGDKRGPGSASIAAVWSNREVTAAEFPRVLATPVREYRTEALWARTVRGGGEEGDERGGRAVCHSRT